MKTLEEFIEKNTEVMSGDVFPPKWDEVAAEILRVAEEYVDDRSVKDLQQAGWLTIEGALMTQVRLDFLDYLKQYITGPSTSASLEEKEGEDGSS